MISSDKSVYHISFVCATLYYMILGNRCRYVEKQGEGQFIVSYRKHGGFIMEIRKLDDTFSICKVSDYSQVDLNSEYCFIGKTDEEKSLVCITDSVPDNVIERDDGWRAFRIQGILDFSLIGILSKIAALMAENGIGIFAVSTYNTDYILTKEDQFKKAIEIVSAAGYTVVS